MIMHINPTSKAHYCLQLFKAAAHVLDSARLDPPVPLAGSRWSLAAAAAAISHQALLPVVLLNVPSQLSRVTME